jgi:long-chain fatty acid transport protein
VTARQARRGNDKDKNAMRRLAGRWSAVAGSVVLAAGGQAHAAGYALKEQSATAQGNAFAGATAGADDVSYMFFNPAALGWVDKIAVTATATLISPKSELKNASGSTAFGTPITGATSADDIGEDAVVPAFYAAAPLPAGLKVGVGVNVPFGLETSYARDWVGRYHAVRSELQTVNINPALAWRPVEWLSAGVGFQAQYADGTLTNAIDFGTIGAASGIPGASPGNQDGFARLRGDDWAYGWNAGAIVQPLAGTRIGVAYRSEIDHTLNGDVNFTGDDDGIANIIRGVSGAFTDTDAKLGLTTPATLSIGVHQDLTERVAVMAEAQWTDWSVFDQLTIKFDNPNQPDSITEEEWEDTWFFALGTTFKATDAITLRAGVAYDQSPVKDKFRTPRIPDGDRRWLSLGAGWQPAGWLDLDASFTYIDVEDTDVRLSAADTGNAARGNLDADYDSYIILLGLSARMRF